MQDHQLSLPHWIHTTLQEVVTLQRGHDLTDVQRRAGDIPVISAAGRYGSHDTAIVCGPGVVIGRSGASIGHVHFCDCDYWPHNTALYVTSFHGNNARFIYYLLQSLNLRRYNSGGAQPSLNRNFIYPLEVVLPAPPEQGVIASALSDMDGLLAALEALIAKKRAIKQATMQQLLTGKTRLPGFSGGWETKRLGEVALVQRGQLITEATLAPGSVPVVAGGKQPAYFHNRPNRTGRSITISASGANAGFVAYWDIPIFASDCSTIGEGATYSIEFIFYQLVFQQADIYRAQTGGAQPHIHPNDLNPLIVAMPPLAEQRAIAAVLVDMDTEIAALERWRDKTRALQQSMMQQLLTGRVRLLKPAQSEARA